MSNDTLEYLIFNKAGTKRTYEMSKLSEATSSSLDKGI